MTPPLRRVRALFGPTFDRPTGPRELSKRELDYILDHWTCPYCREPGFWVGPQGGLMTNIECVREDGGCGAGFNVPPAASADSSSDGTERVLPEQEPAKSGTRHTLQARGGTTWRDRR